MTQNSPGNARPRLQRRRLLLGVVAAGLVAYGFAGAGSAAQGSPDQFIQRLGDRTVAILKAGSSPQQKLKELKQVLNEATDLPVIGRLIMGQYWRQASEAQQQEYLKLFDGLVMQAMAERFSWYSGETFKITESSKIDDRDSFVRTQIIRPTGEPPIAVDWRVRQTDQGHILIDIVAEGISLVQTQRNEVYEIAGQSGIDGLLQEMRNRLAKRDAAPKT